MRHLVNRWSPLTHASYCVTTSRPAAATRTTDTVSPAMHRKVFLFTPDARPALPDWLRGTVVERWSLTGELSLSYTRPAADG